MALVRYELKPDQELTPEQHEEIARAVEMPIVYDEDCPKLTPEMLKNMTIIRHGNRALSN